MLRCLSNHVQLFMYIQLTTLNSTLLLYAYTMLTLNNGNDITYGLMSKIHCLIISSYDIVYGRAKS